MTYRAAIVFKDGITRFIEVRENEKLLDAALRFGISLPMDCREGVCSTCRGRRESGTVEMEYVDEDALSAAEIESGAILACQSRLKSDGSFYFDMDAAVCSIKPERYQATVIQVQQISEAAASLTLQLDKGQAPLHYLPGQYARLSIPGTDQHRAYSYANAVDPEGKVRFLIRLLPSGVMSDYLRQRARPGDRIELEGPLGAFYLRQLERPLCFVAGGTGLSAFLSMLDTLLPQAETTVPIRLFYGVTKQQDLSELDRLQMYRQQLANFDFKTVVMQPEVDWQGECGVVTDILDKEFVSQPFDAYLCGPPPMIEATQRWLEQQACREGKVYFEKFISS